MGTSRCEFKSFIESLEVGLSRLKMIAIYFVYHISSNKRPQYLFNFEALRCCAYWRSAFKRGRLLFQGGAYFPVPDFAFILCYLFLYYFLQPESVTETTQADHTANIKAKDNNRSDKKSNNSSTSVISEKKNIVILGDSMIKHVNGYEMSEKLENCKVYVKSFSGTKVRCMKDHMKPSMRKKPDHTILHVGTNDLNSDRPSDLITKSIVYLAITLKKNSQNVSVSNIIMRNDNFNEKAMDVNGYLKQLCIERNIFFDRQYQNNPLEKH